jgi:hypothetical protein
MIDWTDPAQMMHQGQTLPINTPEKYDIAREAAMGVYLASGRAWDADADQQFERRVLNGLDTATIVAVTLQDRKARFDEA